MRIHFSLFELELPASIPKESAVKVAEKFHDQLFMTSARIIVKQRDDNPNEAVLLVTRSKLTAKYVDILKEEGISMGKDDLLYVKSFNHWRMDISALTL